MQQRSAVTAAQFESTGFVRGYIVTMRPYLLFLSGITGIVGLASAPGISTAKTISIIVACFLSYGFGQALTDCFQLDTDSIAAPYRPLVRGTIARNQVLWTSIFGLGLCISILAIENFGNLALGAVAGFGLATYTPFKRTWWGGPFYNAWIVVVLCVMGFLCGKPGDPIFARPQFAMTLLTVFFGYANFVLAGYFKDITADRLTGYKTLPVVYGRAVAAWTSDLFALLALLFGTAIVFHDVAAREFSWTSFAAIGFITLGIVTSVTGQLRLHRVRNDDQAHAAIAPTVHSYMLLLSGIAISQKPDWTPFLIFFYTLFVFVLNHRPATNQI